jgi:hypothetical protein
MIIARVAKAFLMGKTAWFATVSLWYNTIRTEYDDVSRWSFIHECSALCSLKNAMCLLAL